MIHSVGEGVADWRPGDAVVGVSEIRGAQAEYALLESANVLRKPDEMAWDTTAVTPTAGATTTAVIRALQPKAGETLVVAGASDGVGIVVVQRAAATGCRIIATASEPNHDFLHGLGLEPVTYGDGLEDRIRNVAPDGVNLAARRVGCQTLGMYQLDDLPAAVQTTIDEVQDGRLQIPIKAAYPLEAVQDAYRRLSPVVWARSFSWCATTMTEGVLGAIGGARTRSAHLLTNVIASVGRGSGDRSTSAPQYFSTAVP